MLLVIAYVQAIYFFLTGVWPILHIRSFMAVTGPKTDIWLVKTVGLLVGVIGLAIGLAAYRHELSPPVCLLAIGAAASLTAIDVWYVARRVIAKIYLLDALVEVILIAGWVLALLSA